jgi:hypothetical protein
VGSPNGFTRLRRVDMKGFDQRAQNMVLMAMERGGVGRISTKGHAILRSPNGQTMSVSRNTAAGNRSFQNMEADFRRCFGDLPAEEGATHGSLALAPPLPELAQRDPDLECPLDSCEAVFVTEGARYDHVQKKHYPCKEPGCQRVFDKANKASGHYNITHGRSRTLVETPCDVRGCDFVAKSKNGLGIHKAKSHKAKPKRVPRQRKAPTSAPPLVTQGALDAEAMIARIRELVAPEMDRALREQLEAANARIAELEAKLARIKQDLS